MISPTEPPSSANPRGSYWAIWSVVAAFGTYFCMYGFRKPFTAASYAGAEFWGIEFKTLVVSIQVIGYMLSKFIGIKVVSELPPERRAMAILVLILFAECSLVLFGVLPRPWNAVGLFLNGLALGMVFGLVIGFLEGRRLTELLTAGLCTSFILADGVTKSVGTWLLERGVTEDWMPSVAGLLFLLPLGVAVWMLAKIPQPSEADVAARAVRSPINRAERLRLYAGYAWGLSLLMLTYLLITIIRSIRADFAPELWLGLGMEAVPGIYTRSEMIVALGVMLVNALAVYVIDNRRAFFVSLGTCCCGFLLVAVALVGWKLAWIGPFPFMVLIGLGLYLPYVAMHTTVFERLLAMTRERGNLGFLMYLADAFGYLGYIAVMFGRSLLSTRENFLQFFISLSWVAIVLALLCVLLSWRYFATREPSKGGIVVPESVT